MSAHRHSNDVTEGETLTLGDRSYREHLVTLSQKHCLPSSTFRRENLVKHSLRVRMISYLFVWVCAHVCFYVWKPEVGAGCFP